VTARDILYGRRGGRMVPWTAPDPKHAVGQRVYVRPLTPGEDFIRVEVVELRPLGYVVIRFPSGAEISVDQCRLFSAGQLGERLLGESA
jgi:hypothetical protein